MAMCAEAVRIETGADQFVVTVILRPSFARLAGAMPTCWRAAVRKPSLAAGARRIGKIDLVRKARVLGPDTRIDDTDDDVLPLAFEVPDTPFARQAKVIRCTVRRRLANLVLPDVQDIISGAKRLDLGRGQDRSKAIQCVAIAVYLLACPDGAQRTIVRRVQVPHVFLCASTIGIDLASLSRLCSFVTHDVALIGDCRIVFHHDDVDMGLRSRVCRWDCGIVNRLYFDLGRRRRCHNHAQHRRQKCCRKFLVHYFSPQDSIFWSLFFSR